MSTTPLRRRTASIELGVGAFLLLALASLLVLAFASTNGRTGGGPTYRVTARFSNIGELHVHAPVKIGGVVVGEVADITLDRKNYQAVVTLAIQDKYKSLPADTNARILTAGLLGERYMGLDPGGDTETIPAGGEIIYTQGAVVLEELIGKFIFGGANKAGTGEKPPSGGTSSAAPGSTNPTDHQPH